MEKAGKSIHVKCIWINKRDSYIDCFLTQLSCIAKVRVVCEVLLETYLPTTFIKTVILYHEICLMYVLIPYVSLKFLRICNTWHTSVPGYFQNLTLKYECNMEISIFNFHNITMDKKIKWLLFEIMITFKAWICSIVPLVADDRPNWSLPMCRHPS